ncbi:amino-acid carrier protein AlsT [Clostridium acetireducens DSM 10703]|uniref:Amino-acid carrier protein AlsT n=1 Tax=Clostridium acetireducens DSM 10703 TaxID=1121290 RepID=A0A1E8F1U2_9CLOT|nr:sodium:alanine symporter family protein [Clostridium acetireducens]OFI07164.1 amino-acid carrier protein AlsT [Clostridium acetireducens DSM 10703]
MDKIMAINSWLNGIVWGPYMLILLLGTGIYITLGNKFFTIRKFGIVMKNTLLKMFSKEGSGEGEISAFQAVSTALASTIGTGNIVGVATAVALGGPGAIFWMWMSAIFGMATKFAEVTLSINYRIKKDDGSFVGGPMYYIERGLKLKWLAVIFAIMTSIAALGTGNMVQSNSIASILESTFGFNKLIVGIILAVVAAIVMIGGIKSISKVTEKLVPFMAGFYIIGALVIIIARADHIGYVFALIFKDAFKGTAMVGGFAGSTMAMAAKFGIARGIFSNEGGLGSAPIAHAAATTDHPVRQGLWGIFEVFTTLIICTLSGLILLVTDVWKSGLNGADLSAAAFNSVIPGSQVVIAISILLFAFSTILGWSYYGEKALEYLFGEKVSKLYKFIWIPLIVVGSVGGLEFVWALADTFNGMMAIPNLIAILALSKVVFKLSREFFSEKVKSPL